MTEVAREPRKRRPPRRPRSRGCGGLLCLLLTALAALYLLALVILQKGLPESYLPTFLLTYLPQPPLLFPLAAVALLTLLLRQHRLLIANLLMLVIGVLVMIPPSVPTRAPAFRKPVRVVTWNLHENYHEIPRMREEIAKLEPDIVCLQEARRKSFGDIMPQAAYAHTHEVTTLTRGRIVSSREIRLGPYPNYRWGLETVIDLPQGRVRVFNVHFITAFTGRTLRHNSYDLAGFIEHTREGRTNETEVALKWLAGSGANKLLVGDFNTPPNAQIYRQLTAEAVDAFRAGWGWGLTYRRDHPLVRIDHIFLRDGVLPARAFTVDGGVSDHRMMVADVVLGEDGT